MTDVELTSALEAEERLAEDLRAYEGEWVAISNHKVVAHAVTLDELVHEVEGTEYDAVLSVAEAATAAAFF